MRQFGGMGALTDPSRSAAKIWLTSARVERWAGMFLGGYVIFFAALIATAHGFNDAAGRPLGADFSSFYSAGLLARLGQSPYDQLLLHHTEQTLFGAATPYFGFSYPPVFLLLLAPLSLLPYPGALLLWQTGSLTLYAAAMMQLRRRLAPQLPARAFFLASLAFTAVFVSLTCGQNGLLTAALLACAVALLDAKPFLAGVCIGLLAYKPQLGLLLPFALAASGRWRAFAAAGLTLAALSALSAAAFGMDGWRAFLNAGGYARQAILDQGLVGYYKMVSVFAGVRLLGAPLALAYGIQAISALTAILVTIRVWRSPADFRLQIALLGLATFFVTPFALDYDLTMLAPALALMAAYGHDKGANVFETAVLALLWIVPMLVRPIALLHLPGALTIAAAALAIVWARLPKPDFKIG